MVEVFKWRGLGRPRTLVGAFQTLICLGLAGIPGLTRAQSSDFVVCPPSNNLVYSLAQQPASIYAFDISDATLHSDVRLPIDNAQDNSGSLNALLVDQERDRLLYVAQTPGSGKNMVQLWVLWTNPQNQRVWVQGAPVFNSGSDIPRGAMDPGGVGYLITGAASPTVWRLVAATDGSAAYTVQEYGRIVYNGGAPNEQTAGDVVFDKNGNAWIASGKDLYRIDASEFQRAAPATLQAAPQARPTLPGNTTPTWSGIAFGSDGLLYLSHNGAGQRSYYQLDSTNNTVIQTGTAVNQHEQRDMASCMFPVFPPEQTGPAVVTVHKSLGFINGVPVASLPTPPGVVARPGNILTYEVLLTNLGESAVTFYSDVADLSTTVTETVPANTTFASGDGAGHNNSFRCTKIPCQLGDVVTVPGGQARTIYFIVKVNDAPPPGASTIVNTVALAGEHQGCTATGSDCSETTPLGPRVTVSKTASAAPGVQVKIGDTITYTLRAAVSNSQTLGAVTLADTLGAGLQVVTPLPAGCVSGSSAQVLVCTLPAGTAAGVHTFVYAATVRANAAVGTLVNTVVPSGQDNPSCATAAGCTTDHELLGATVAVVKSANPASGTVVNSGGPPLTFTVTVVVSEGSTHGVVNLPDTLNGLTAGAMVSADTVFTCTGIQCVLNAGTLPGTYSFAYTATVNAGASVRVTNVLDAQRTNTDDTVTCQSCATEHPVDHSFVAVTKQANPASGSNVAVGTVVTYTITARVTATTTGPVQLQDVLHSGLTFLAIDLGQTSPQISCTFPGCTLAQGTPPGTYLLVYTATVNSSASLQQNVLAGHTVTNTISVSGNPADNPVCAACDTEHGILAPSISVTKSSNPPSGTEASVGQTITYTLTVRIRDAPLTEPVQLIDNLSGAQALIAGSVVLPPGGSCTPASGGGGMQCMLPANTAVGDHVFTYQALIAPGATQIANLVQATGGGDPEGPECASCGTAHAIGASLVTLSKQASPASGSTVFIGDDIAYTITVLVEGAATSADLIITDTPGPGLTLGSLPAECVPSGSAAVCTLPAGRAPGRYFINYTARVTPDAAAQVRNSITPTQTGGAGQPPRCIDCSTMHKIAGSSLLRVLKTASVRSVRAGDLVLYTVQVQNLGDSAVRGVVTVDSPPAGFSYVEGSLTIDDPDDTATISGFNPIRIEGVDVAVEAPTTISYLMRVGAGVRVGTHVNEVQVRNTSDVPISNVATATVETQGDPLLDESLIMGSVFDDRDGDGWQDSAALTGIRVRGGFDPRAYVPGSTTVNRGSGPQPVADASAPLLDGQKLGDLEGRSSAGDPPGRRTMVISQHLRDLAFNGDFVLTSREGVTLRMDALGNTRLDRSGDAARGLTAAEPVVERRVARTAEGYVVEYRISNAGIDERGIPGVRVASVEGLLMETDSFGRYHVVGVSGGDPGRGRNFILKADPATLPAGAVITTGNPLLRRVTPGVPVRFDFGAKVPVQPLPAPRMQLELQLGEIIFEPGSSVVRHAYGPAIDRIAQKIEEYQGGEILINANGGDQLAVERARAVRTTLEGRLSESLVRGLTVSLRNDLEDEGSQVLGLAAGQTLLGTVLFDTDKATIRPEFEPLLDRIAAGLTETGGGVVAIVGHTDIRASHEYNVDLGLRRATAVYEALAKRLSPQIRARLRVESTRDYLAPVDLRRPTPAPAGQR